MAGHGLSLKRCGPLGIGLSSLCAALSLAGAALAQTPDAAASTKPALDPERVAIARQIFDQIGAADLEAMSKAMVANMQGAMTKAVSGPDAQRQQAMMDAVTDSIAAIMPKAIDATVDAMAEDFDTAQLKDVLAFYTSPTGRLMIKKLPLVMRQTSATMIAEMPQLVREMEVRYCARITCTTTEHQAFAAISANLKARAPG